jgi:hypothetical protein
MRYGVYRKYYHTAEDEKWKCCNFAVTPRFGRKGGGKTAGGKCDLKKFSRPKLFGTFDSFSYTQKHTPFA